MSAAMDIYNNTRPDTSKHHHNGRRRTRRKRRPIVETPCTDCIQRASLSNGRGDVRFCNECARALGQARSAQPEAIIPPPVSRMAATVVQPLGSSRVTGGIRRQDHYRRRATTNRLANALRTAQSVSPVASRHGPFQFVSMNQAREALTQAPPANAEVVSCTTPVEESSMALTERSHNSAPTARSSTSPMTRKANVSRSSTRDRFVDLPQAFRHLEEAYDVLDPVHDRLAALIMAVESSTNPVVVSFSQDNYRVAAAYWLCQWESAFARYLSINVHSMTADQRKAAMTLKAHHLAAECFASVQPAETCLDWSGSSTKFQAILDLAEYVMRDVVQVAQDNDIASSRRTNSIDAFQTTLPKITILDPVLEVQMRTTNVTLRDRARHLLSIIRPREFFTTDTSKQDGLSEDDQPLFSIPSDR